MSKTQDEAASRPPAAVGRPWVPGQSGNPNGRAALPPEVRAALKADTLERYNRLKKLSIDLEAQGDLKGAATIELALLKKQIPDLSSMEVTGDGGGPLQVESIDLTKLNAEELAQLRAMRTRTAK